jgi:hypothetical protein
VLYGSPPDLSRLKRFGKAVWVHDPDGSKLDPRACEGHWIGFDIESRGHRVYWVANRSVSVEHNVYFAAAERLEGEQLDIPSPEVQSSELPAAQPSPAQNLPAPVPPPNVAPPSPASSLSSLSLSSSSRAVSDVLQLDEPQQEPETELRRSSRNRTASCWVRELQDGVGVSLTRCADPVVPRGVTIPGGFEEAEEADFVDELAGAWSVEAGLPMLRENWLGFEFALVVTILTGKTLDSAVMTTRAKM